MMEQRLVVLLDGSVMGEVRRDGRNNLSFAYDIDWKADPGAIPLSLSLPTSRAAHVGDPIESFIWGLLPDNELVLERWARNFQVSARNPFGLIASVGEDCAGAAQFVRPERLGELLAGPQQPVQWLTEVQIAERLRALREDQAAWRLPRDIGQFSLAGAQAKTALLFQHGRWGVPSGRMPTTHILKPQSPEFDGHAENEHFCLTLARALGLPAPQSNVQRFGHQVAIVVERYDRAMLEDGHIARVHQEDMCQALGVMPTSKYQSDGGPRPADIAKLLRENSSAPQEDVDTFADALVFNWLIGGTDAHAKNYSVLHGSEGQLRLAPLYDLASALPYEQVDQRKLKLAMRMGREYLLENVGLRQWQRVEGDLGMPAGSLVRRARRLTQSMMHELPAVVEYMRRGGLNHRIIGKLAHALQKRAVKCAGVLAG